MLRTPPGPTPNLTRQDDDMSERTAAATRRCYKCGQEKLLSQFNKNRSEPTGYQWLCRTCQNDASRAYHAAHKEARNTQQRENARRVYASQTPEARWASDLKNRHGITPAQWQAMRDDQDGLCYLCLRPLLDGAKEIHIDHDHRCCQKRRSCSLCRRGLTCRHCNVAIGAMGDDPERMRLAAANLERAQAKVAPQIMSAPKADRLF